jgi:hypothetical protein
MSFRFCSTIPVRTNPIVSTSQVSSLHLEATNRIGSDRFRPHKSRRFCSTIQLSSFLMTPHLRSTQLRLSSAPPSSSDFAIRDQADHVGTIRHVTASRFWSFDYSCPRRVWSDPTTRVATGHYGPSPTSHITPFRVKSIRLLLAMQFRSFRQVTSLRFVPGRFD